MYEFNIVAKEIEDYVVEHSSKEDDVLYGINRDTHLNNSKARMLSGPLQGQLLTMIAQMVQPKNILDIGTFTGYSAICLAKGLQANGKLITIDSNKELAPTIEKNIAKSNKAHQIEFIIGDAVEEIKKLEINLDLVFIDADKENYVNYYHLVKSKMNSGGFIIADNVLWGRKVIDAPDENNTETQGIISFNKLVKDDDEVEKILLPFRDGLFLIRKK